MDQVVTHQAAPQAARSAPEVTLAEIRRVLRRMAHLDEVDGFGVCGSLAGQQARRFDPKRSDIDIFLVLKDDYADWDNQNRWMRRIMAVLERRFWRRSDVIIYTLRGLKKIPSWHTISMASDCPILYDPEGKVADVFRRIVDAARAAGLAQEWHGPQRVWAKQNWIPGEDIVVEVHDDDG